jgi:hypothetical protein
MNHTPFVRVMKELNLFDVVTYIPSMRCNITASNGAPQRDERGFLSVARLPHLFSAMQG